MYLGYVERYVMSLFLSISFKQLIVMNTLENGATLFASSYPTIEKRISVPGVVLSLIMLLAGIVLFLLVWLCDLHTSTVSMALMVAGIALILWAVFRLFWKVNKRIYTPTGSVVEERTLYFGQEDSQDCGSCDICRAEHSGQPRIRKALASYIIEDRHGDYTLDDISVKFGSPASEEGGDYLGELRELIDRGEVPPYKI